MGGNDKFNQAFAPHFWCSCLHILLRVHAKTESYWFNWINEQILELRLLLHAVGVIKHWWKFASVKILNFSKMFIHKTNQCQFYWVINNCEDCRQGSKSLPFWEILSLFPCAREKSRHFPSFHSQFCVAFAQKLLSPHRRRKFSPKKLDFLVFPLRFSSLFKKWK